MPSKNITAAERKLVAELKTLTKEVKAMAKQVERLEKLEFIKVLKKPGRLMWLSLLKGMMAGLGSVLGATVLVALLIFILSKISFVPIVGEFVQDVMQQIEIPDTK